MKIKSNQKNLILFFLVLFLFPVLKAQAVTQLGSSNGFFWVGNNFHSSTSESGYPAIGMIKLAGDNYGVNLEDEMTGTGRRVLTGSAWIGVGSTNDTVGSFTPDQGDHPSLGWLKFDQGVPNNCESLDSSDTNGCHPVTWNRRQGAPENSLEGYLSGWAKFEIGKDALGNAYPEIWVHFKTPSDTTGFSCDDSNPQRGSNYYVCTDNTGAFKGYAWSSGLASASKNDNPGFGWIGFKSAGTITSENVDPEGPLSACYILNDLSSNSICGDPGVPTTVHLFANFLNEGAKSSEYDYKWSCSGGETFESGGQTKDCVYAPASSTTYIPKLMVKPKTGSEWTTCSSSTSVINYYTEKTCQVEAREYIASGSTEKYEEAPTIYIEKEMEARVRRYCVKGGTVVWGQPQNGRVVSSSQTSLRAIFNPAGDGLIGAQLIGITGGGNVTCKEAKIKVRDKVKWGL